jgi:hypothetical protein
MKRKHLPQSCPDAPVPAEEYRMFANQGEAALRSYRLARISMAIALPTFAPLAAFHAGLALALAVAGGIAALLLLRKNYGLKAAAAPLLCALSGAALGAFLIAPLAKPTAMLQEAYFGF